MFQATWDYLNIPREMVPLVATSLTGVITLFVWFISWLSKARQDREAQHRSNYLQLELESSRIFMIGVESPEIPKYLRGELSDKDAGAHIQERTYWFVCQVLNIFEIAISFKREGKITSDLFATWVSWLHELGTSRRFGDYWIDLRTHYKRDLQRMLDVAQERLAVRPADLHALDESERQRILRKELRAYHEEVAEILEDPAIIDHYDKAMQAAG